MKLFIGLLCAIVLASCSSTSYYSVTADSATQAENADDTMASTTETTSPATATETAMAAAEGDGSVESPVKVGQLASVTVDGDAAEWASQPYMPAPFSKKAKSSVKLAWNEEGLYGLVTVTDNELTVDTINPWTADAFELWLERDFARAPYDSRNAGQYVFVPGKGDAKASVIVPWGGTYNSEKNIKVASKKTDTGYVLEFFIPKTEMAPAKLEAGTKIGMNFAVDNNGEPAEQFFADKNTNEAYRTPKEWGAIQLKR